MFFLFLLPFWYAWNAYWPAWQPATKQQACVFAGVLGIVFASAPALPPVPLTLEVLWLMITACQVCHHNGLFTRRAWKFSSHHVDFTGRYIVYWNDTYDFTLRTWYRGYECSPGLWWHINLPWTLVLLLAWATGSVMGKGTETLVVLQISHQMMAAFDIWLVFPPGHYLGEKHVFMYVVRATARVILSLLCVQPLLFVARMWYTPKLVRVSYDDAREWREAYEAQCKKAFEGKASMAPEEEARMKIYIATHTS